MLGACNTCVRLQSRVTSSGATVDGVVFIVNIIILFVFILVVVFLFVIIIYFVYFYYTLYIYYYYLFFPYEMGVVTKDRFFHKGSGMGVEALIRILGFWGKLGIIIFAGQSIWEVF